MNSVDKLTLRSATTPITDIWRTNADLYQKITDSGTPPVFGNCRTYARLAEPSHYHTPLTGTQLVLWMMQNNNFLSWEHFLNNQDGSLENVDHYIANFSEYHPHAFIYMMQGYGFIDQPKPDDTPVIPRLTATIEYPHLHLLTEPIPEHHQVYTYISAGQRGFRKTLVTQADYGMDFITNSIADELHGFGVPCKMINTLGVGQVKLEVPHTIYRFPSMSQALQSSHELTNRMSIKARWPELIFLASKYQLTDNIYNLKIRIAHSLSVMHIMPTAEMCRRLNLEYDPKNNVYTLVGTVAAFSPFVRGGFNAKRGTPESK